jgi:hypothetical protein
MAGHFLSHLSFLSYQKVLGQLERGDFNQARVQEGCGLMVGQNFKRKKSN